MSKIIKWGNSLAIRIPYKLAEELNLIEGGEVVLEIKDNQLIIKKESLKSFNCQLFSLRSMKIK